MASKAPAGFKAEVPAAPAKPQFEVVGPVAVFGREPGEFIGADEHSWGELSALIEAGHIAPVQTAAAAPEEVKEAE